MKRLLAFIISTTLFTSTLSCMNAEYKKVRDLFPTVRILKLNTATSELIPVWQSTPDLWYFDTNSKDQIKTIRDLDLFLLSDGIVLVKTKGSKIHRISEAYFVLRVPCGLGDFRLSLKNISFRINLSDAINTQPGAFYRCNLTGIDIYNRINVLHLNGSACIDMIFNEDGSFITYNLITNADLGYNMLAQPSPADSATQESVSVGDNANVTSDPFTENVYPLDLLETM